MDNIKNQFPIYKKHPDLTYLDNGATTLKPQVVLDKIFEYYNDYGANIHRGLYDLSERATLEYGLVREKTAGFIGAKNESEIVFTKGTTAGINLVARGWGENNIEKGDEIVVTEMEHHSNLVPWQKLATRRGAKLRYIKVNPKTYELEWKNLKKIINNKTKVLALTHVSNVLGTVNPVKEIIEAVKKINSKIIVVVDGAQAVAHMKVDVRDLGCDAYAFSAHKMYGPTGVGVLWMNRGLMSKTEPVEYGGGAVATVGRETAVLASCPERFEAGTPQIAAVLGLGAAIDFVLGIGWDAINEQETYTLGYLLDQLKKVEGVKIFGKRGLEGRTGVVSFTSGVPAHDICAMAGGKRLAVCLRGGLHCAMPLHEAIGAEFGTVRATLGIYNGREDVDKLIRSIKESQWVFEK